VTTIANITLYFPRKYRETIEIKKHPNNLNGDNGYNISQIENHSLSQKINRFYIPLSPPLSPTHQFFPPLPG